MSEKINFTKEELIEIEKAKKATPVILEKLGESLVGLAPSICNAMTTYGCRNQIAIVDAVKAIAPEFADISDRFFARLNDTIEIATKIGIEDYEIIVSKIMENENATLEEKVNLAINAVKNLRESQTNSELSVLRAIGDYFIKFVEIVVGFVAIVIGMNVLGESNKNRMDYKKHKITEKEKTKRAKCFSETVQSNNAEKTKRSEEKTKQKEAKYEAKYK